MPYINNHVLDINSRNYISSTKGTSTIVYAHNLSGFDGIFLIRHLLSLGEVKPLIHNGKILSIRFKCRGVSIIFKDSYLLLPLSLRRLCVAFAVSSTKGYFPFGINDIFYRGVKPVIELWNDIPLTEYERIPNEWNFQEEAIVFRKLTIKLL